MKDLVKEWCSGFEGWARHARERKVSKTFSDEYGNEYVARVEGFDAGHAWLHLFDVDWDRFSTCFKSPRAAVMAVEALFAATKDVTVSSEVKEMAK